MKKKLQLQRELNNQASSTIKDLGNIVNNYAPLTKTECLLNLGQNSIDQGLPGEEAANELGAVLLEFFRKLKPYRPAFCK